MKYLIANLIWMASLVAGAAPSVVITKSMQKGDLGVELLAGALSTYADAKFVQITPDFHDHKTGKVYPSKPSQLAVVSDPNGSIPGHRIVTNFIVFDGDIFEVNGLTVTNIEKVGDDLIKLSGLFVNAEDIVGSDSDTNKCNFAGVKSEIIIKFTYENYELKATVVSQKDTEWCH